MLLRGKASYQVPLPADVLEALEALQHVLPAEDNDQGVEEMHSLLKALWMRRWSSTPDNPLPCPTIRSLALMSLKTDRSFTEPVHVTGIIAKLERAIRLTCLWEIKSLSKSKYNGDDNQACDNVQHWFTEKVDTPFNHLRSLQHRASAIAYSTMSLPRIWWTDRVAWTSMLYKGSQLHLDQMKGVFQAMEDKVIAIWEDRVLLGQKVHVDCGQIVEDLTNRSVGYCFLNDDRNQCFKDRDHLLKAFLKDRRTRATFTKDNSQGRTMWNKDALRTWLRDYGEFQALQLARVEMLSGASGRGTELSAMNLRSTQARPIRNLLIMGDHLVTMHMYHKTGNLTGRDKMVPHSLDALTSDLMVQDLALARPFAEVAVHLCFPGDANLYSLYRDHLFVDYLKPFSTEVLTETMASLTLPITGIKMGVNAYRHINIAWKRKLCVEASSLLDNNDDFETVTALQACHSRATENRVYGLSTDALSGAPEDILPLYLDCSTHWQVAMGVVPG